MYKFIDADEYCKVVDECAGRVRKMLEIRCLEVEKLRDEINDRYPFEDLYLKMEEVDSELLILNKLIETVAVAAKERKAYIMAKGDM